MIKQFVFFKDKNGNNWGITFIKMKRPCHAGYDYSVVFEFYQYNCEILFEHKHK